MIGTAPRLSCSQLKDKKLIGLLIDAYHIRKTPGSHTALSCSWSLSWERDLWSSTGVWQVRMKRDNCNSRCQGFNSCHVIKWQKQQCLQFLHKGESKIALLYHG